VATWGRPAEDGTRRVTWSGDRPGSSCHTGEERSLYPREVGWRDGDRQYTEQSSRWTLKGSEINGEPTNTRSRCVTVCTEH
jgi:hypothetical protein